MNKIKALFTILILGLFFNLQAQEVIPSSGGEATGSGGSASYTVGQVVYKTNAGTNNNSIAEGVQQPFEISEVTGIEEAKDIDLVCKAYPNPVIETLQLEIGGSVMPNSQNLNYKLIDINGKILENKNIETLNRESITRASITMKQFAQGIYFLKVYNNQKIIKIFKIVKH